jgi:hypothetical protein
VGSKDNCGVLLGDRVSHDTASCLRTGAGRPSWWLLLTSEAILHPAGSGTATER